MKVKMLDAIAKRLSAKDGHFHTTFLLDDANWGLMYANRSINAILVNLEIAELAKNEKAKGRNKAKPQVRGKASVGNSKVLNKPANRVGRKTKGV